MRAQVWLGRRTDVSGILSTNPVYCGGQAWLGTALPQLWFDKSLLDNPLFSHLVVMGGSWEERLARSAGFAPVFRSGEVSVLAKQGL